MSLLDQGMKLAQYAQGIGFAERADRIVLRLLKPTLHPLMIFDVGANRGNFVELALKELAGHPLNIHAFEPSRVAFAELTKRYGAHGNIVLNDCALGNESGEKTLYFDKPGSVLSSLYKRRTGHHGISFEQSEAVRIDTLDQYGIKPIDLLKLDVEGHELAVLKGATGLLEDRQIAMISFEFGGCNVDSRTYLRDFFEFFEARGMTLSRVTPLGLKTLPRYEEALEQFRATCFVAR